MIQWQPGMKLENLPHTCMVRGLPMSGYLEHPALGSHRFKDFLSRGARFYAMKHIQKVWPDKESEDLEFGKAFETFVCEGERVMRENTRFWPPRFLGDGSKNPEFLMTTVEGKAWATKMGKPAGCKMDEWTFAQGRPQLESEVMPIMQAMMDSLREHEAWELIIDPSCEQQITLFGALHTPHGPVRIKSRPDFFLLTGNARTEFLPTTLDLKALKSKDFEGGIRVRTIVDYCYELQATICRELTRQNGIRHSNHRILACEKDIPHRTEQVQLTHRFMDVSMQRLQQVADKLAAHVATNEWPRTSGDLIEMELPNWYRGKLTEEY